MEEYKIGQVVSFKRWSDFEFSSTKDEYLLVYGTYLLEIRPANINRMERLN